jgi:predicted PurR-regulated permease PerM
MAAPPSRPPSSGRGRPASPPDPAVQQRAWTAMALGLLSLLALFLASGLRHAVYVVVATLVIGALAAWLGGTAMSRARKGRTRRPGGAVAGIVLGLLGLAFSGLTLIVFALFWNQLSTYWNCTGAANTMTAQQVCQHQLSRTISNDFGPFSAKG